MNHFENKLDLDAIVKRFQERINHFGAQPYGVLWSNAEQQVRRFELLLQVLPENERSGGLEFADFGCGYGAMYSFLKDQPVMQSSTYTGYDITKGMIDVCNSQISEPDAKFIHADKMQHSVDYTFVSGTFTLKCNTAKSDWELFVKNRLLNLWNFSRKGLAFNFLDAAQTPQDHELYYANADDYLEFCAEHMSCHVSKVLDEGLEEFTILVRQ